MKRAAAVLAGFTMGLMPCAGARTLTAGPGGAYKLPSAAIAAAKPGDVVRIMPGRYRDCATLNAGRVTIEGKGAVMADRICQGKAILVIGGRDDVVRGLTLTGATVPDGNGAGIRDQSENLTVDRVTFTNDEDGILTAQMPGAILTVTGSSFRHDGACIKDCAHGIYAGHIGRLTVRGSNFSDIQTGHDIKSRARSTVLENDTITDGPDGTSSYLVDLPNGGNLLMRNDRLEKGPNASNTATAISIGEEGHAPAAAKIVIEHVRFTNDSGADTVFVRNLSHARVTLRHNSLGGAQALAGPNDQ